MRAIIDPLYRAAQFRDLGDHTAVNIVYRLYCNRSTRYTGLIGTDYYAMPGSRQLRNGLSCSRQETEFLPTFDVIRAVLINHPVAVKKYRRHYGTPIKNILERKNTLQTTPSRYGSVNYPVLFFEKQ